MPEQGADDQEAVAAIGPEARKRMTKVMDANVVQAGRSRIFMPFLEKKARCEEAYQRRLDRDA
jgi:hypothetical protein